MIFGINGKKKRKMSTQSLTYGVKSRAVGQVWHVGTHFSFLFSIYSENHGVQAVPLNFARSSDITYVPPFRCRYPGFKHDHFIQNIDIEATTCDCSICRECYENSIGSLGISFVSLLCNLLLSP